MTDRPAWALCILAIVVCATTGTVNADETTLPAVEIATEEGGLWTRWTDAIVAFQRRANTEVARHMNAIDSGQSLGAFFLGLAIAFVYGVFHAFGPGHGKFIIVSYFLGRDARVGRGIVMAIQVAIVHVIAAIVIVWLADITLQAGFGIGLAEVPGVRAASFLIIAAIGLYMLYQAFRPPWATSILRKSVTVTVTPTITDTHTTENTVMATDTAITKIMAMPKRHQGSRAA